MTNMLIRPARPFDLPEINAIFNYYVSHSTCVWTTTPCTEAERKAWYEEHGEGMPVLVAECDRRTVGWGALSSFRAAYTRAGTVEDSVYVHHEFHRQGIGGRLLSELIAAARSNGHRSILAHISGDQEPSIQLHQRFGFREVGRFREVGWKFNRRLDAVYLQLPVADNDYTRPSSGQSRAEARTAEVVVRPVEDADRPWVRQLLTEQWSSPRIVSRGRVHQADQLPGFIAWINGERAGLATYRIAEQACEIVSLNSLRERKGVGTLLIRAVQDVATKQGCTRVWLVTGNDCTAALRFYQRRGFVLVALHRNALEESRKLKPEMPVAVDGIPLRDEIELEMEWAS